MEVKTQLALPCVEHLVNHWSTTGQAPVKCHSSNFACPGAAVYSTRWLNAGQTKPGKALVKTPVKTLVK
jgi:hypothetical protein